VTSRVPSGRSTTEVTGGRVEVGADANVTARVPFDCRVADATAGDWVADTTFADCPGTNVRVTCGPGIDSGRLVCTYGSWNGCPFTGVGTATTSDDFTAGVGRAGLPTSGGYSCTFPFPFWSR